MEKSEHSEPTYFKVLQRESSVYKYYIELKEGIFTEHGYIDLVKVPNLYVFGAGQFIRNLRVKNGLRQKDIAKILNVSHKTLDDWERNTNRMPLQKLVKITETLGISRDTIYSLIDKGKFNTLNSLPTRFEKFSDVVQYLSPYKTVSNGTWRIGVIKRSNKIIPRIKATIDVSIVFRSNRHALIYSKELYTFLKTFFRYSKIPKINPPLTKNVKRWYDNSVDLKRAIIIPCLQSDGGIFMDDKQYYLLCFYGYNKILHDYFVDAMYFEYKELPSTFFAGCYLTQYHRKSTKKIVYDVMNLAGNTKTAPSHEQKVEDYIKEQQPHLDYLKKASRTEQNIALRIWASTEGCVSIFRTRNNVYPGLYISCAHPNLAKQLQQIARRFNIHFCISRSKRNWSGIQMLSARALCSCIEFLKLGGFINGVKINSNSRYHEGVAKDALLLGILEFKKLELENSHLKKLSLQQVHHEINKIIKTRDYKSAEYYINYFS